MMISGVRSSKSIKPSCKYIRKRCYKNFDSQLFIKAVQELGWLDLYLCNDVNEAVDIFTHKITNILDSMAPLKTIQVRSNFAPFLSKKTLELMKARNELHRQASESNCKDDWVKFKKIRNEINNRLKYEEYTWQKARLEECSRNSSKTWKRVKGILNWQNAGSPSKLFYKGTLRTKAQDIADSQNEYFIEKIQLIQENLAQPAADPLSTLKSLMVGRKCSFGLSVVHPDQVDTIISNLSNTSAFGFDLIDTYILKLIRPEIVPAVTHILNLSISTKKFPMSWKKSKIIPLHKKDDPLNPKNYRPVAIVPIVSKILERVVFNQLFQYLDDNNLLHPNHHAYRAGHNTTTALIQMYDGWLKAVESGQIAGACFLDMSAAFDVVNHDLLLQKLSLYGLEFDSIEWVRSYLEGRSQSVLIDGCQSKLLKVCSGVPQGSILGPLFYTLFTNELPEIVTTPTLPHNQEDPNSKTDDQVGPLYHVEGGEDGDISCYADDTTLSMSDQDSATLSAKLSMKYKVISQFMVDNKLKLNDEKTHLLVMGASPSAGQVQITTPTGIIQPSSCEKLLGCWISKDMTWTEFIKDNKENLMRSLNMRLGAVRKIRSLTNFKNRKIIAEGVFMSKLSYLIALWGGCGKVLQQALQRIQNKAAQAVTRNDWSVSNKENLKQCGWMSVRQLSFYHSVLLVYKTRQSKQPRYLYRMHNSWAYPYRTRQAENELVRVLSKPNLELAKDSFRWRAANCYNQLPSEIRTSSKIEEFKSKAKPWIMENVAI